MSSLRNPHGFTRPALPAFDVQGHRGAPGPVPGNTLPSFWRALALGATTLELDVGVTRDGAVVVSHERRATALECVDLRSPHLGRPWRDLTLAEVRTLDRGAGGFATLEEVLLIGSRAGVRFNIEAKLDPTAPEETWSPAFFARRLAGPLARSGLAGRCTVQSFDWRLLVAIKRLLPEVETVALAQASTLYAGSPWVAGFPVGPAPFEGELAWLALTLGASAIGPRAGDVTPSLVQEAHELGLRVLVWTVNEPAEMAELVELGVDGIVTDDPSLLLRVLDDRARALAV